MSSHGHTVAINVVRPIILMSSTAMNGIAPVIVGVEGRIS